MSLLFFLLAAGCGKSAPPTQIADVTLPPSASAPEPPAPAPTGEVAVAPPLRRSSLAGPAKEVFERRGVIVARDKDGKEAELTTSGRDVFPQLSPDAHTVVFLRSRSATSESPRDIYLVRVDGGEAELLVRDDPSVVVLYYELWDLHGIRFSFDGKRLFFCVNNGRDKAVLAIDLATRKMTAVASGWDYRVIRRGPHTGRLLMLKRIYPPPHHALAPECSIVSSVDGTLIRTIDCMATKAQLGVDVLNSMEE